VAHISLLLLLLLLLRLVEVGRGAARCEGCLVPRPGHPAARLCSARLSLSLSAWPAWYSSATMLRR